MSGRMAGQRGLALIVCVMTMAVLGVIATILVVTSGTELAIADNFRSSLETFYAADAGIERVMGDLPSVDWNLVLAGSVRSSFVDGDPAGSRTLADNTVVDLTQLVNLADCEKTTACSDSDMNAVTSARPWGVNNPRWQAYAYGSLQTLAAEAINSRCYVVVLVGRDAAENDGSVLLVRSEAFGPRGAHQVIEATVARQGDPRFGAGARLVSWRLWR